MSSSSWLGSWRRRTEEALAQQAPEAPDSPSGSDARQGHVQRLRIGLDFGTTSTLIAARVDSEAPFVVPLEPSEPWMPSYYWRDDQGNEDFGSTAMNRPNPVHSIKLRLATNQSGVDIYGMRPSEIATALIGHALSLALRELKMRGRLPATAERLEVASNLGCSAAWSLETRSMLRDIAQDHGLDVGMASVIEEPVAAALSLILSTAFEGGRLLLVDLGGGTLDACVLEADGANRYRIYASGGSAELGGDRYTDLIADHLRSELAARVGEADAEGLSVAEASRMWQEAERVKRLLSDRREVRVQLTQIEGPDGLVTVTRDWFEQAARKLVVRTVHSVTETYRKARLTLDRGLVVGDVPGTPYLSLDPIVKTTSLTLENDAVHRIDRVVLVGGASQMPMIRQEFQRIFGTKLKDPSIYGLEPVEAVVLGLARHDAMESLDFGYPNWAIVAREFNRLGQPVREQTLYSPFAPVFIMDGYGADMIYRSQMGISDSARSAQVRFMRIAPGEGVAWPEVPLPAGATAVRLRLTLLGDVKVQAVVGGEIKDLYPARPPAPWKSGTATHPDFLPPKVEERDIGPCEHHALPGKCSWLACRNHAFGGGVNDED